MQKKYVITVDGWCYFRYDTLEQAEENIKNSIVWKRKHKVKKHEKVEIVVQYHEEWYDEIDGLKFWRKLEEFRNTRLIPCTHCNEENSSNCEMCHGTGLMKKVDAYVSLVHLGRSA